MATRATFLPFSAELPTSNPAALFVDGQNRPYLAFDTTTSESAAWTFKAPQGLTGTLTCVVTYRAASATSGTFAYDASIEAITSGDAVDTDSASSFDTVNTSAADTVPGTAGYEKDLSVTLTNADSIAAGDYVRLKIARNVATDTATGDIQILTVEFRDAA